MGHFRAQGVPMKRKLREFPVTEDALLPVGTCVGVRHFVPGQFVDVAGITMGKGFQVYFYFSFSHLPFAFILAYTFSLSFSVCSCCTGLSLKMSLLESGSLNS